MPIQAHFTLTVASLLLRGRLKACGCSSLDVLVCVAVHMCVCVGEKVIEVIPLDDRSEFKEDDTVFLVTKF